MVDDEPWWALKDVCEGLGVSDARQTAERVDEDDRCQIPIIDALGREQATWCVNESDLYSVIIRSDKPEARAS
jgi:Prophage antirepressor